LYNLNADPAEIADVAQWYPEKVKALKQIMVSARTTNENWKFNFEKTKDKK